MTTTDSPTQFWIPSNALTGMQHAIDVCILHISLHSPNNGTTGGLYRDCLVTKMCMNLASSRCNNDSCALVMHATTSLSCLLVNSFCTTCSLHHEPHEEEVCLNMCVHLGTHSDTCGMLHGIPHNQICHDLGHRTHGHLR